MLILTKFFQVRSTWQWDGIGWHWRSELPDLTPTSVIKPSAELYGATWCAAGVVNGETLAKYDGRGWTPESAHFRQILLWLDRTLVRQFVHATTGYASPTSHRHDLYPAKMKHYVRSTFGDSEEFFGSNADDKPLQGLGQGNGAGPCGWACVSSVSAHPTAGGACHSPWTGPCFVYRELSQSITWQYKTSSQTGKTGTEYGEAEKNQDNHRHVHDSERRAQTLLTVWVLPLQEEWHQTWQSPKGLQEGQVHHVVTLLVWGT